MLKNKIRKLPIVDVNETIVGIITVTDLAMFLLPISKPGLTSLLLRTVSRGKGPRCDSCNRLAIRVFQSYTLLPVMFAILNVTGRADNAMVLLLAQGPSITVNKD